MSISTLEDWTGLADWSTQAVDSSSISQGELLKLARNLGLDITYP